MFRLISSGGQKLLKVVITGLAFIASFATGALAETPLPPLVTEPMLAITGLDESRFADGTLLLDSGRLAAIDTTRLTTTTPWTEGPHEFTGVRLAALIDFLGLSDGVLVAYALNDYSVEIPVSEAAPDGPIIAYAIDGQPMTVRSRGPLWVIYPFDQNPDYRSEVTYTRSIWQMNRLEVRP